MKNKLLVILLLFFPCASFAAIEVMQGGAGQCFEVVSDLKRNWIEVKRHMIPGMGDIQIPKDEDFVCISNAAVRNAMETRTATNSALRCFNNPMHRGMGFCCDERLFSCAQLNPYLFPEELERRTTEKTYEPPASLWVKPPAEGDQWKTN